MGWRAEEVKVGLEVEIIEMILNVGPVFAKGLRRLAMSGLARSLERYLVGAEGWLRLVFGWIFKVLGIGLVAGGCSFIMFGEV